MENPKDICQTIVSAVLLMTLGSTVAYVFSEEHLFRPPTSRSRTIPSSKMAESVAESGIRDFDDSEVSLRPQRRDLGYLTR